MTIFVFENKLYVMKCYLLNNQITVVAVRNRIGSKVPLFTRAVPKDKYRLCVLEIVIHTILYMTMMQISELRTFYSNNSIMRQFVEWSQYSLNGNAFSRLCCILLAWSHWCWKYLHTGCWYSLPLLLLKHLWRNLQCLISVWLTSRKIFFVQNWNLDQSISR